MIQNDKENISLKQLLVDYIHQWKYFATAFGISILLAAAYLLLVPKTYEIAAKVELRPDQPLGGTNGGNLNGMSGILKSFGLGSSSSSLTIDDETAKFMSVSLLEKAVLQLGLQVNYAKPFAYKYNMYNVPLALSADSATNRNLWEAIDFNINILSESDIRVSVKSTKNEYEFSFTALPATIKIGEGIFMLSVKELQHYPYKVKATYQPARWVAEELSESLSIDEYSKSSNVLELGYRDYEKQRGIDLLNTLIVLYNQQEGENKKREGESSTRFLDERLNSVITDLNATELTLEAYKLEHQITDIEYDMQFYSAQMKELQMKIIDLEAQANVIELLDAYIKDPENRYNLVPSLLSTGQSSDKNSPILLYNDALLERESILLTSKADNPLLEKSERQIEQLRQSVFRSIENARQSLELTISDLKTKEKSILAKMGSIPSVEKGYMDIKRKQEIYQAVYLILLQKKEEIALNSGDWHQRARTIEAVYAKKRPVAPRKLYAAIGMLMFTIIVPVGCLFVKNHAKELLEAYKDSCKK